MEQQLSIKKIEKYLLENQWQIEPFNDFLQKILSNIGGENIELVIPKKENLNDYEKRVKDLVFALAIIKEKNFDEVFEEILNFGYDLMSFHFESDKIKEGFIPLDYASDAMKKIVEIIKFEACSEINPKSQYKQPYKEARKLVENCELAQTEPGSFIINVRVPLDKTYLKTEETDEEYINGLGRRTIKRLIEGINEAKEIQITDDEEFKKGYNEKLNKNVCDALSEILISNKDKIKLQISTKINPQEGSEDFKINVVSIDSEKSFNKFNRMAYLLKEIPEDEVATIEGKITEMKRQEEDTKEEKRLIKIYSEKLRRNIYSWLEDENYRLACDAHKDKKIIKISGMLTQKESGKWFLDSPSAVVI